MPDTGVREPHVSLRWLLDLHDGVLSGRRLAETRAHLGAGCTECAGVLAWIERAIAALAAGALPAAPRRDVRFAEGLYRETHRLAWHADDAVAATLLFDRGAELAASVRAAVGDERRLLWRFDAYELDASVAAAGAGFDLLAQLLPDDDDPDRALSGAVELLRRGRTVATARVRPDGRFTFRAVRPGIYALRGEVDGARFVVSELVLD